MITMEFLHKAGLKLVSPTSQPKWPDGTVPGAFADLQGDPIVVDGHLGGDLVGVRGGPQMRLAHGYHWGRQRVLDDGSRYFMMVLDDGSR